MKKGVLYEITVNGTARNVRVRAGTDGQYFLTVDDADELEIQAFEPERGNLSMLVGGNSWECGLVPSDEGFTVGVVGIPHDVAVVDPKRKALRTIEAGGAAVIRTAMPGRIVRVLVSAGDTVEKGDPLVVVEAMKMENELKAPGDGIVKRVAVAAGDVVEARAVLIELA